MTTTMDRTGLESRTTTAGTEILLAFLHDAVSACAEQDPDALHARTPAGSALISLAALARVAAGALGALPGTRLTDGPGVVVVRDLVAATRLLASAASSASTDATGRTEVDDLVATAKGLHAELLEAMTAAA